MMYSPIAALIAWIRSEFSVPAYFEVPEVRNERFATVKQAYDSSNIPGIIEAGMIVCFFDTTPEKANDLGQRFEAKVKETKLQGVDGCTHASIYNGGQVLRDETTKQPYRQVDIEMICHAKGK